MSETASCEVRADNVGTGAVFVGIWRVACRAKGCDGEILKITKAIENVKRLGGLSICFGHGIGLMKRRGHRAGKRSERGWKGYGLQFRLQGSFSIKEEEELVLNDRTTDVAAELAALKRGTRGPRQTSGKRAIAELAIGFTVKGIGPRTGYDVYGARGSEFVGKIE